MLIRATVNAQTYLMRFADEPPADENPTEDLVDFVGDADINLLGRWTGPLTSVTGLLRVIIIAIGVVVFLFNLLQFVLFSRSKKRQDDAKDGMKVAIVGALASLLFVELIIWAGEFAGFVGT